LIKILANRDKKRRWLMMVEYELEDYVARLRRSRFLKIHQPYFSRESMRNMVKRRLTYLGYSLSLSLPTQKTLQAIGHYEKANFLGLDAIMARMNGDEVLEPQGGEGL
jgi:spore maturation protein CgeB